MISIVNVRKRREDIKNINKGIGLLGGLVKKWLICFIYIVFVACAYAGNGTIFCSCADDDFKYIEHLIQDIEKIVVIYNSKTIELPFPDSIDGVEHVEEVLKGELNISTLKQNNKRFFTLLLESEKMQKNNIRMHLKPLGIDNRKLGEFQLDRPKGVIYYNLQPLQVVTRTSSSHLYTIVVCCILTLIAGLIIWRLMESKWGAGKVRKPAAPHERPPTRSSAQKGLQTWSHVLSHATGGLADISLVRKRSNIFCPIYVMKALKSHLSSDVVYVASLQYEAHILSHLKNKGCKKVPRVVDTGFTRDKATQAPWIVMTYFKGVTLKEKDMARFKLQERLKLIHEIAIAIAGYHAAEVAHRDLSPDNIVVAARGALRLVGIVDFGSASLEEQSHPLGTKWVLKQRYAAPEQMRHGLDGAGKSADLNAFALIACEILLGQHPFAPVGYNPKLNDHLNFDRINTMRALIAKGLRQEVAQALAGVLLYPEPEARGTMGVFLAVLQGAYRLY